MPLKSKKSRVALFFAFGLGLALLMAGLKAVIAWAAATYLYSVPWVGGFLRSVELLEVSNLLCFSLLGAGIGAATIWLPRRWTHRAKLSCLLALSPFVFSASYMMQQNLWIKTVAAQGNIPYREARDITNAYLKKETGSGGFFGFFPLTTQLAELPTRLGSLQFEQSANASEQLIQELSSYDDPRADIAAYVFARVGWLIRFMYMTIAALAGLIYYFKGHAWAENRAQANVTPVPVPARATSRKSPPVSKKKLTSPPQSPANSAGNSSGNLSKGLPNDVSGDLPETPSSRPSGKPVSKPYRHSPPNMPLNGATPKPPSPLPAEPEEDSQL